MAGLRRMLGVAILVLLPIAGCAGGGAGSESETATATGESLESAIVIEADSTLEGVPLEYDYVRQHYPGWKVEQQHLLHEGGRSYDQLDIVGPGGERKSLFFDITGWYGKL